MQNNVISFPTEEERDKKNKAKSMANNSMGKVTNNHSVNIVGTDGYDDEGSFVVDAETATQLAGMDPKEMLELQMDNALSNLFFVLSTQGFSFEKDNVKDIMWFVEGLRSLLYRSKGWEHGLHKVVDSYMEITYDDMGFVHVKAHPKNLRVVKDDEPI